MVMAFASLLLRRSWVALYALDTAAEINKYRLPINSKGIFGQLFGCRARENQSSYSPFHCSGSKSYDVECIFRDS